MAMVVSYPDRDSPFRSENWLLAALMSTGMVSQFRAHFRAALYSGISQVDIVWFTNTFNCIIAAEHRIAFKETMERVFADEIDFLASRDAESETINRNNSVGE